MKIITNKNLLASVEQSKNHLTQSGRALKLAVKLFARMELSDKADFNLFGASVWVSTNNREDVEKVLAIAPRGQFWAKSSSESQLDYNITIDGVPVKLRVSEGALPPTCRVETVEVELPAQPARMVTRQVLKCDQPAEEAVSLPVAGLDHQTTPAS